MSSTKELTEGLAILRQLEFFDQLADEDLLALLRAGTFHTFVRGEIIFRPDGERALQILLSGTARAYRLSEQGGQITLPTVRSGAVLGVVSLDRATAPSTFIESTSAKTWTLRLSIDRVSDLLEDHPDIGRSVLLPVLSRKVVEAYDLIEDLGLHDISTRVAHQLAESARGSRIVNVNRSELARAIGTTPDRVSRVLNHLRRAGTIEFRPYSRQIQIRDVELLTSPEHGC